jgi:hypothetical protein
MPMERGMPYVNQMSDEEMLEWDESDGNMQISDNGDGRNKHNYVCYETKGFQKQ